MYRIRFHGRGGQGIKTAGRILGTAFFRAGFEVQDAPRYGAERRGAPISATVRADLEPIWERGLIHRPDLVIVVDGTLLGLTAAGVLEGLDEHAVLLIDARWDGAFQRLHPDFSGRVLLLPELESHRAESTDESAEETPQASLRNRLPLLAMAAAGAAARLSGVVTRDALMDAVEHELRKVSHEALRRTRRAALGAYEHMSDMVGFLNEGEPWEDSGEIAPDWVVLRAEPAHRAAPTIFRPGTAVAVPTGLWRTERPVIDPDLCKGCWWICATFCPDGVVSLGKNGVPVIDYDHCKGCMICRVQCPSHAIASLPEGEADTAGIL